MPYINPIDAIRSLIRLIGDDPDREGLLDTPHRVLTAWEQDWGRGYRGDDPADLLKTFEQKDGQGHHPDFNEMVIVKDIAMFSHCEHHLAPFFGVAHIAYIPSHKGIVGLSKLVRIVDHFSRRLQVQERLTCQIADCLAEHLSDHVAVSLKATHMCMASRGVIQPNARTVTNSLKGNFRHISVRAEFLAAVRKQ